jgi:hypothetical protein
MATSEQSPVLQPKTADDILVVGMVPTVKIGPLFRSLLNSAQQLLSDHHYGAAVLVAETAIEVCTERIIARALGPRAEAFHQEWLDTRTRPYILGSKKRDEAKKIYQLLTGDEITQASFWHRLTVHVERRHAVAHKGQPVEPSDAADSVAVAEEVVQHIATVAAGLNLDLSDRP